ncbi:MAG: DNA mismatch repair protein MutS, partial [Myxococcota bacterium]
LCGLAAPRLAHLAEAMDPLKDVFERLTRTLLADPAQSPTEGRIIADGFDAEVDELVGLSRSGKDWILEYERTEREQTRISSLKVRFNKVFGYFIEVTRANLHLVPETYIRKQTISNGERYFTMELKEYETKVLSAEENRIKRETELFEQLRTGLKDEASRILRTASRVADLDVLCGLADAAHRYRYVRPTMTDEPRLELEGSRHPVVEGTLSGDEAFVPNDVTLDPGTLLLITGPNMAGKSTVMRQVALTVLMAQIGSFVPADRAVVGLTDRIFTRVGATDDLSRGQSTFMVEMSETAFILKNATAHSLIILDEIGRGTSTFDGLSIAWAVAEHIHDDVAARTMFATHYHELTELSRTHPLVRNVHVAVREWNDDIVFLRKLQDGGTNRSYGIQVGRLAGLPEVVLQRARDVLAGIEKEDVVVPSSAAGQLGLFAAPPSEEPAGPTEVERALARVDLNRTTPLEALRLIDKLQKKLSKGS